MSDTICFTTVDIHETDLINNGVILYPVPATDLIQLTVNSSLIPAGYRITEPSGKMVMVGKLDSENSFLNVSSLASGVYFLEINSGKAVATKRILKK